MEMSSPTSKIRVYLDFYDRFGIFNDFYASELSFCAAQAWSLFKNIAGNKCILYSDGATCLRELDLEPNTKDHIAYELLSGEDLHTLEWFHDYFRYYCMTLQDKPWVQIDLDCFLFRESQKDIQEIEKHLLGGSEEGIWYYANDVNHKLSYTSGYSRWESRLVRRLLGELEYTYSPTELERGGNLGFSFGTPKAGYIIGSEVCKAFKVATRLLEDLGVPRDGAEQLEIHHWISGVFPWYVAKRFGLTFRDWEVNQIMHVCGTGQETYLRLGANKVLPIEEAQAAQKKVFDKFVPRILESRTAITFSEFKSEILKSVTKQVI